MRFGNYFKLYNILDSQIMNLVGGWSDKPNLKGETENDRSQVTTIKKGRTTVDGRNPSNQLGCKKHRPKYWDKPTNLNWFAGFLNHRQYVETTKSISSFSFF